MTISCPIQTSINEQSIQDGIEWDESVWLDSRAEEIKAEILSEDGYTVNSANYNINDVLERIADSELLASAFSRLILSQYHAQKSSLNAFIGGVATGMANQFAADELAATKIYEGL